MTSGSLRHVAAAAVAAAAVVLAVAVGASPGTSAAAVPAASTFGVAARSPSSSSYCSVPHGWASLPRQC